MSSALVGGFLSTAPPNKFKSAHMLIKKKCTLRMVAQTVKTLPAMRETQKSLGREDSLEKGMATLSSILVWRIPRTEESGWLQSMGPQSIGHNSNTHRHMSALVAQQPYVVKSF